MARGIAHDPSVKAAAIAALLTGQGVDTVAAEYRLPESTVKNWKREIDQGRPTVEPQKRVELGDLIAEYLRETMITLTEQARFFRDPEWLKKQPAESVAVLHGVQMDKAIRIFSALEPPDSEAGDAV